jgi:peptide/nickel transport system substrate-binding protein
MKLRNLALCLTLIAPMAMAEELKLAMSTPATSMDPHFNNLVPNINVSNHMFETLIKMNSNSSIGAGLAESWTLVNKLTWEFKLRKGVKFHDGSEMTAEDVLWSMDRPATIVGSPGKFDSFTRAIIKKEIVDTHTIRFSTKETHPLMLADLTSVFIVSKKATQGLSSEAFNTGKGMVGTGPFKFVKFQRDDRVELARFDGYWGQKTAWDKVTLRFIPNGATRVAALLSGDVHAIENVPTPDLARVKAKGDINVYSKTSHRLIFLALDGARDQAPLVTKKDGSPLPKNPLQDLRVRKALSMAINRDQIRDQVMEGLSEPTNNLVPPALFGHNAAIKTVAYDPEGAKKLLAQAGFPDGFGMTLHTPNNRYVNDEKITQAIAQMLAKVGIDAKVKGLPISVFSARGAKREFGVYLFGWGAQTGESSTTLRSLIACEDAVKGYGGFNWTKYCNPRVDAQIIKAMGTADNKERLALLQDATAIAVGDVALIPLHHQVTTWAAKKGYVYQARTDERTLAQYFTTK